MISSHENNTTPIETCDVVVVGGGPAGTTAATLLARRGRSVQLFEKQRHPRFHIGESLLPMNLPILERLGVLDAVEKLGVRKLGADFPATNERGFNVFDFSRNLERIPGYAFQVPRAAFDELLFKNTVESGVSVHEGTTVVDAVREADGYRVTVADAGGARRDVRARYLIDASGRDTLLGSQMKLKRRHPRHRSAAIFAHFTGVERRAEPHAGNISIYRFHLGWIWVIPLPGGITSIGAVCHPAKLKERRGTLEEFLLEQLHSVPQLSARLAHAKLAGHLEATGNYSYDCRELCGPGWIMVGDAGAFLDPVFSSGVYLAMHSAERAAGLVDAVLAGRAERPLQRAYTRELRGGLKAFSWFIVRFTTPALAWLFANPRNTMRVEEAMISMLAGHVFESPATMRRLKIFKALYYITSVVMWRDTLRHRREVRRAGAAA